MRLDEEAGRRSVDAVHLSTRLGGNRGKGKMQSPGASRVSSGLGAGTGCTGCTACLLGTRAPTSAACLTLGPTPNVTGAWLRHGIVYI